MSEQQTGKTLIRLLLQKQSDRGLTFLSKPFFARQEKIKKILFTCSYKINTESVKVSAAHFTTLDALKYRMYWTKESNQTNKKYKMKKYI